MHANMEYSEIYNSLYTSADYDNSECTDNSLKWDVLLRLISSLEFSTVLDLGCGRGYYLKKFMELNKNVIGVEFSSVCCNTYLKGIPHVNEDLETFLRKKDIYDLVICMDVLEHIEPKSLEKVIEGIRAVSKTAIIGVANHVDNIMGHDLHLITEGCPWWSKILNKFYDSVEEHIFSEKFYIFKCE